MLFTYTAMVALFTTPKDGTLLDVMIKLGETMLFTYTAMVALFTTPKDGNLLQQHTHTSLTALFPGLPR